MMSNKHIPVLPYRGLLQYNATKLGYQSGRWEINNTGQGKSFALKYCTFKANCSQEVVDSCGWDIIRVLTPLKNIVQNISQNQLQKRRYSLVWIIKTGRHRKKKEKEKEKEKGIEKKNKN